MQDPEYTGDLDGDIHTKNQKAAGLTPERGKTFLCHALRRAAKVVLLSVGALKKAKDRHLRKHPLPAVREGEAYTTTWINRLDNRRVMTRSDHRFEHALQLGDNAKQWCVTLHEKIKAERLDAKLVAFVHDELQLDCAEKDAERVGQLAVASAKEAGTILGFRVPVDAEYSVGMNWKETH